MRQDAPGPTAPSSASFAVPPPPRKPARRLRRLLRALLFCLVLLLLLAGGGLGWLCTASGQSWLRETLNATLTTALETSGLRLTVRKLEGLPFHPRLAVCGEDAAGRWLDLPDVALSWRLGWQDGLVLHLDPLALNGGGLYRLPQLTGGQYSFEERMGCGFGACVGCTCKTKYGSKRICKDGPVLFREEIVW